MTKAEYAQQLKNLKRLAGNAKTWSGLSLNGSKDDIEACKRRMNELLDYIESL